MQAQGCPCGRRDARARVLPWPACCGRYVGQATPAPDAESLMRSRYSAYVTGHVEYLLATWHASSRPSVLALEPDVKWLGLTVREHRVVDTGHAEVEFVARSRLQGQGQRLHERSRFVREAGRWFYLDGDLK